MVHRPESIPVSRTVPVKIADLVLSGGGVKAIGLVGAVVALGDAGYRVGRVSGTSAGSLVGAVIAAANRHQPGGPQLSGDQLRQLAMSLPYRTFLDPVRSTRIPVLGKYWTAFRGQGMYGGDAIHDWVDGELRNLGVRTFGDLALDDPELPLEQRYRLVVTVADVTRGTLVRLPWD